MKTLSLIFLPVVLLAAPAFAQSSAEWEPILLPVSLARPIAGAFGSVWATDFVVTAVGGEVRFETTEGCGACPVVLVAAPNGSLHNLFGNFPGETPGELVWLLRADAANARFSLRIRDLSRESQTLGTEVPVVRESDYRSNPITLTNVPADSRFRVTLRTYDPDVHQNAAFRFDFLDMNTGSLLASRTVNAVYKLSGHGNFPRVAACAEIGDLLPAVPEISNATAVRVDIRPVAEATRFWALASVTNNQTQDVTLVTPQQKP